MATAKTLEGRNFRLYLSDGTTNANRFDNGFVCLATDLEYKRTAEFEDVTKNDCDNPGAPAVQESSPRFLKTEVSFGGTVSALKIQPLEAAWEGQVLKEWRIVYDETTPNGGETHTGFAYVEELAVSKQNAGAVRFTCKLKAQGAFARASV